jgi:hypothetical protein
MKAAAYDSYLIPTQRSIAEQLTIQLLPRFSDDQTERVDFDYSDVRALQEDADALAKRAATLFASGIYTRAQALTLIGDEPTTEDDGIYFLPRGGSFSNGEIAEPVSAVIEKVDTVPGASNLTPPPATNGTSKAPVPATATP